MFEMFSTEFGSTLEFELVAVSSSSLYLEFRKLSKLFSKALRNVLTGGADLLEEFEDVADTDGGPGVHEFLDET